MENKQLVIQYVYCQRHVSMIFRGVWPIPKETP
jgi:hypothetical protein